MNFKNTDRKVNEIKKIMYEQNEKFNKEIETYTEIMKLKNTVTELKHSTEELQ